VTALANTAAAIESAPHSNLNPFRLPFDPRRFLFLFAE